MITLPQYIVEKVSNGYAIWDTVNHEYTGFEFPSKMEASDKAQEFNSKSLKIS